MLACIHNLNQTCFLQAPPPGRTTCAADLTALAGRTPSPSPQFADSTRQVARASMEKLSVMYEELTLNSPQPGKESLTVGDAGATIPNTPHGGTPLHGGMGATMQCWLDCCLLRLHAVDADDAYLAASSQNELLWLPGATLFPSPWTACYSNWPIAMNQLQPS